MFCAITLTFAVFDHLLLTHEKSVSQVKFIVDFEGTKVLQGRKYILSYLLQ